MGLINVFFVKETRVRVCESVQFAKHVSCYNAAAYRTSSSVHRVRVFGPQSNVSVRSSSPFMYEGNFDTPRLLYIRCGELSGLCRLMSGEAEIASIPKSRSPLIVSPNPEELNKSSSYPRRIIRPGDSKYCDGSGILRYGEWC